MPESDGWIKLHRSLINDSLWKASTPEQKVVLVTILLMVNRAEAEWEWQGEKFRCQPGQKITSLQSIQEACGKGISIKNVRTAIKKLVKHGFLASEAASTGRLITINNWEKYQGSDVIKASQAANKRQTSGKQVATNKNDKTNKTVFVAPTYEEVLDFAQSKDRADLAKRFFDHYEEANPPWTDNRGSPIRSWRQKFNNWCSTDTKQETYKKKEYLL